MELNNRLEPVTKAFVDASLKAQSTPLYDLPVQEGRKIFDDIQSPSTANNAVDIEDHTFPFNGETLSLRIVKPRGEKKPLPVVMFYHGAGWVFGDYQTHGRLVEDIAVGVPAAMVFVNYSLAPEVKYPTQIEEDYAALCYIAEQGKQFNLDNSRLAVMGDSVGGNMAIAMTLMAKKRKGPKIDYQVLLYPVTDANFNTPSYQEFAQGPWLTKKAMEWFWDNYLPNKTQRKEALASPLQAKIEDLNGLPPALVITAECDVLRDEGEAYAHKLESAGVSLTAIRHQSTIHDFLMLNAISDTPAPRNALRTIIQHLRTVFAVR